MKSVLVDQWSCWSPILEVVQGTSGVAVAAALDRAIASHGKPNTITVDHGTESSSRALDDSAYRRGVTLAFIRPRRPSENGFIESFNGKLRDESLNANQLLSNQHPPHSALGHVAYRFEPCADQVDITRFARPSVP